MSFFGFNFNLKNTPVSDTMHMCGNESREVLVEDVKTLGSSQHYSLDAIVQQTRVPHTSVLDI